MPFNYVTGKKSSNYITLQGRKLTTNLGVPKSVFAPLPAKLVLIKLSVYKTEFLFYCIH